MAIQENKSKASWKCYEKERIWPPPPSLPECLCLFNQHVEHDCKQSKTKK